MRLPVLESCTMSVLGTSGRLLFLILHDEAINDIEINIAQISAFFICILLLINRISYGQLIQQIPTGNVQFNSTINGYYILHSNILEHKNQY